MANLLLTCNSEFNILKYNLKYHFPTKDEKGFIDICQVDNSLENKWTTQ